MLICQKNQHFNIMLQLICQKIWKIQQWSQDWKKVSFHSNLKEGQCQRMFKIPYNCTHFTCQRDYAQNPLSQVLAVHELRTSQCKSWIQKRHRNQRSNDLHLLGQRKSEVIPKISASLMTQKSLTMWITTNCEQFLKRWEYQTTLPDS